MMEDKERRRRYKYVV